MGKPAVAAFVTAFDIPGLEFVALKVSDGEAACCFTWKVVVNGQDGPQGLSFYQAKPHRIVRRAHARSEHGTHSE